jgi:glutathione S-transferase
MIKLYHIPLSFNSRRVWVALLEKKLEFEAIEMKLDGDQFAPDFLALNPFHHIPVLVDNNGFRVLESLAILDYLDAKYPHNSLLPANPESLAIVKMVNMVTVNELVPAMNPLSAKALGMREVGEEEVKKSHEKINLTLTFFQDLLGDKPYFGGENITVAECVFGTVASLFPLIQVSLNDYPQLNNWLANLSQRESFIQTAPTAEMIDAFRAKMKVAMQRK